MERNLKQVKGEQICFLDILRRQFPSCCDTASDVVRCGGKVLSSWSLNNSKLPVVSKGLRVTSSLSETPTWHGSKLCVLRAARLTEKPSLAPVPSLDLWLWSRLVGSSGMAPK